MDTNGTSPATPPRKALVIGGSLGGLFTATALRAAGWEVDVFERSASDLDSRGGGIVLQPEVLRAFSFAGIAAHGALGVRSHDRLFLDRAGNVLSRQRMPQTQTSWNTLFATLRDHFPAARYHRGAALAGIEQDEHAVHATFADGRQAHGQLLVGADGADSTVRKLLLPDIVPSYAGYVVWRGLVDENRLPEAARPLLHENFVFQHEPDSMMLQYMVPGADGATAPGQRRFNWLWYLKAKPGMELDAVLTDRQGKRRSHSIPPGLLAHGQEAWFRQTAAARANPAFRALIDSTGDIFVHAIQDLQVPRMVFGRALLIGDAAFVPRPHTAGSTAKAAANAVALARALDGTADTGRALRQWQQDQLAQGEQMARWGIQLGDRIMGMARH